MLEQCLEGGPHGTGPCQSMESLEGCSLWEAHVASAEEGHISWEGPHVEQEKRVTMEERQRLNFTDRLQTAFPVTLHCSERGVRKR